MKTKLLFLSALCLLLNSRVQAQSSQCIQGDCSNGLSHVQWPDRGFSIGFRKDNMANGIGARYSPQTAKDPEFAEFNFFARDPQNEDNFIATPKLSVNFTSNAKWLGLGKPGEAITKGIFIDSGLNVFIMYASGNLPADLSQPCLDGDCADGYGALKFTDSKSIDHYYYGQFSGGKFSGQGVEMIAQSGQVLVGHFENDNCTEGILYRLEESTATYYKDSQPQQEFTWQYVDYVAPIDPSIAANEAARIKAEQDALAAKKQNRRKFWGNFLGAAVAVTAVAAVVALSDDGSSSSKSTPSKSNTATKSSTQNTTSAPTTPSPKTVESKPKEPCWYAFTYDKAEGRDMQTHYIVSNVFRVKKGVDCRGNGYSPTCYQNQERAATSERREDMLDELDSKGWKIVPANRRDQCDN